MHSYAAYLCHYVTPLAHAVPLMTVEGKGVGVGVGARVGMGMGVGVGVGVGVAWAWAWAAFFFLANDRGGTTFQRTWKSLRPCRSLIFSLPTAKSPS